LTNKEKRSQVFSVIKPAIHSPLLGIPFVWKYGSSVVFYLQVVHVIGR